MRLAAPDVLERRSRVIARVESLIEPDFDQRYFDFDEKWDAATRLAGMRSGEGDHYFIWFGRGGTLVRGFAKGKKPIPPKLLFAGLPPTLNGARDEKAFQVGGDSFALWWPRGGKGWQHSVAPGALPLLFALDGNAATFARWVKRYYGKPLDIAALAALFTGTPLNDTSVGKVIPARAKTAAEGAKKKIVIDDDDAPIGDAEFKVVELDGVTKLVIGGKVQAQSKKPNAYMHVLRAIRKLMK